LGILHIVYSTFGLLIGIFVFTLLSGVGWVSRDPTAMGILGFIGFLVGGFLIAISIPGIFAGIGLVKMSPWSRVLAIVMGCLHLLNIPIGTALGVYTFWVLLNEESVKHLSSTSKTPT
jgi:hypothetical protein